jgi:hypothetical protein
MLLKGRISQERIIKMLIEVFFYDTKCSNAPKERDEFCLGDALVKATTIVSM